MKRLACLLCTLLTGTAAHADPGHLSNVAGHDHWPAAGASGGAVAVVLLAGATGHQRSRLPSPETAGKDCAEGREC